MPLWPCVPLVILDVVLVIVLFSLFYITGILAIAEPKPENKTIWWTFFSKSMIQFYAVTGTLSVAIWYLSVYIANTCF